MPLPTFFDSQAVPGYAGVFSVSSDAGVTWHPVGELKDVTLNLKADMVDSSSHSSGGWKISKPGLKEWSATASALAVFADAGQKAMEDALMPGTRLLFQFDPAGAGSAKPRYQGYGFIADFSIKSPGAEMATRDITITGASELVISAQT